MRTGEIQRSELLPRLEHSSQGSVHAAALRASAFRSGDQGGSGSGRTSSSFGLAATALRRGRPGSALAGQVSTAEPATASVAPAPRRLSPDCISVTRDPLGQYRSCCCHSLQLTSEPQASAKPRKVPSSGLGLKSTARTLLLAVLLRELRELVGVGTLAQASAASVGPGTGRSPAHLGFGCHGVQAIAAGHQDKASTAAARWCPPNLPT
mmetsp:Transcript_13254/g.36504  ORF Transcript_13254/g.36504 Transcript_13254/m.36504 type:complete len:209 (+) Transcript_13254:136-762(+)